MKALGLNFTKLAAERKNPTVKDIKINNKLDISSIEPAKTDLLNPKEGLLKVIFTYLVEYSPGVAKVNIEGSVLLSMPPKQSKQILKDWKKKKIQDEFKVFIYNFILNKSSLKALELEDELNLPPHIPLPRLK